MSKLDSKSIVVTGQTPIWIQSDEAKLTLLRSKRSPRSSSCRVSRIEGSQWSVLVSYVVTDTYSEG
jgi:hypothetical protein